MMVLDYSTVTEMPGNRVTGHAMEMLITRYSVARQYCDNKEVLEVACGSGQGLGYLAQSARRVIGGDCTGGMLRLAQEHYRGRVGTLRLDAQALPFRRSCFDTVVFFEALYYLERPDNFLEECRRVLNREGVLVLCTVNKDWSDFNPSPFSTRYYSAPELFSLLTRHGFQTDLFGAFATTPDSLSGKAVSLIKRTAVSLNLMPSSMQGKEWLKRIFYGHLTPLPAELEEAADYEAILAPVPKDGPNTQYKVLYAIGRL